MESNRSHSNRMKEMLAIVGNTTDTIAGSVRTDWDSTAVPNTWVYIDYPQKVSDPGVADDLILNRDLVNMKQDIILQAKKITGLESVIFAILNYLKEFPKDPILDELLKKLL